MTSSHLRTGSWKYLCAIVCVQKCVFMRTTLSHFANGFAEISIHIHKTKSEARHKCLSGCPIFGYVDALINLSCFCASIVVKVWRVCFYPCFYFLTKSGLANVKNDLRRSFFWWLHDFTISAFNPAHHLPHINEEQSRLPLMCCATSTNVNHKNYN